MDCKHKHISTVYNDGHKIVQVCDDCKKENVFFIKNETRRLADKMIKSGEITMERK